MSWTTRNDDNDPASLRERLQRLVRALEYQTERAHRAEADAIARAIQVEDLTARAERAESEIGYWQIKAERAETSAASRYRLAEQNARDWHAEAESLRAQRDAKGRDINDLLTEIAELEKRAARVREAVADHVACQYGDPCPVCQALGSTDA